MNQESQALLNSETIQVAMNTLKIRTFKQTNKILKAATENTLRDYDYGSIQSFWGDAVLFVVAGPNGSGKSTVISHFLKQEIYPGYYICPDYLVEDGCRDEQAYLLAMDKAESLRKSAMEQGVSFTVETVLSSESKLEFLLEAKDLGYKIIVIYIITSNCEINIERVAIRTSQGGHDVPAEKIIARYNRCLSLMPRVINVADCAFVYDNSEYLKVPKLVQSKEDNHPNSTMLERFFMDKRDCNCTEWDSGEPVGKERFWENKQGINANEVLEEADDEDVMEIARKIMEKHGEAFIKLAGIEGETE